MEDARRRQDRCSLPGRRERPASHNVDLAFLYVIGANVADPTRHMIGL